MMTKLTERDYKILRNAMEEKEREQLMWIRNRSSDQRDFDKACRIFGLDPSLDRPDTINDQHKRRQLS